MKKQSFICITLIFLMAFSQSQATLITNWHNSNDVFGGLRQSEVSPDIYYAVADDNNFDPLATYEMLPGYRQATFAEWEALVLAGEPQLGLSTEYFYYDQGDWNGYVFEGKTRVYFTFADSFETGGVVAHAAAYQRRSSLNLTGPQWRSLFIGSGYTQWAGMVLVKDASTAVPEPSTYMLLLSGLLGLTYLRRKRKST